MTENTTNFGRNSHSVYNGITACLHRGRIGTVRTGLKTKLFQRTERKHILIWRKLCLNRFEKYLLYMKTCNLVLWFNIPFNNISVIFGLILFVLPSLLFMQNE